MIPFYSVLYLKSTFELIASDFLRLGRCLGQCPNRDFFQDRTSHCIHTSCYHPPCSCLLEVDLGWMVEGQASKGWNHDCLDSQMEGCHANQGSLHFMLSQSRTTMGETQICSRQERSDLDTRRRSDGASGYLRCKVNGNPSSRVQVLATDGDDHCLGKRNYDRVNKDRVGTIQYLEIKFNERCLSYQ